MDHSATVALPAKRIGIFQYQWHLQSHTANLAKLLVQEGFVVDMFLFDVMIYRLYEQQELSRTPGLCLYDFTPPPATPIVATTSWKDQVAKWQEWLQTNYRPAYSLLRFFHKQVVLKLYQKAIRLGLIRRQIIRPEVLLASHKIVQKQPYACWIGVEKLGLIWATLLNDSGRIPVIYFSLELFTTDYFLASFLTAFRNSVIKFMEEQCHRRCAATVIQDPDRGKILLQDNKVEQSPMIYLPVSSPGPIYQGKSRWFQEKFGIAPDQKIILQFGFICSSRLSGELATVSTQFATDWRLLFHGSIMKGHERLLPIIASCNTRQQIIMSTELVPTDAIFTVIASAHIGLALYNATPINEKLTAFASEKIALYLQCGIPIIAFCYPEYARLMEHKCGAFIPSLADLPQAIAYILADYEQYRANAYACFEACYDYRKNIRPLAQWIRDIG